MIIYKNTLFCCCLIGGRPDYHVGTFLSLQSCWGVSVEVSLLLGGVHCGGPFSLPQAVLDCEGVNSRCQVLRVDLGEGFAPRVISERIRMSNNHGYLTPLCWSLRIREIFCKYLDSDKGNYDKSKCQNF